MTLLIDKIKITKAHDKRRKLSDQQKREIKDLYFYQSLPIREIARRFESFCSRRLIQFVLFPERDRKLKEIRSQEKRYLKYYDREKHNKAIKELRARKRKINNIKLYTWKTWKNEDKKEKERILKLIK